MPISYFISIQPNCILGSCTGNEFDSLSCCLRFYKVKLKCLCSKEETFSALYQINPCHGRSHFKNAHTLLIALYDQILNEVPALLTRHTNVLGYSLLHEKFQVGDFICRGQQFNAFQECSKVCLQAASSRGVCCQLSVQNVVETEMIQGPKCVTCAKK